MSGQKTYALIIGIILTVIGIWGFFTQSILGLFSVNAVHSILHLIGGLIGLYVGIKGEGPTYNIVIGWVGIVLGILGFVPVVKELLATLLMVNTGGNILHLAIGVVSLIVYYAASKGSTTGMPA